MVLPTNDFTNGNVLTAKQLNDNFQSVNWTSIVPTQAKESETIMAHSPTEYSINGIYGTTDSGATWTNPSGGGGFFVKCKANHDYGFTVAYGASANTYGTTTGYNGWGAKTASPLDARTDDVSYPVTALLVVGGDDVGSDYIWWSTDQGANWTAANTTLDARAYAIDMFDGTTGYAVTSAGKIFKGTAAADTWTDTTDTISADQSMAMYCLTADLVFIASSTSTNLTLSSYVNSTKTVTTLQAFNGGDGCLGFAKDSNGVLYLGMYATTNTSGIRIVRSRDNFVTFEIINIPFINQAANITDAPRLKRGGIDVDSDGNLYVVLPEERTILKIPAMTEP